MTKQKILRPRQENYHIFCFERFCS